MDPLRSLTSGLPQSASFPQPYQPTNQVSKNSPTSETLDIFTQVMPTAIQAGLAELKSAPVTKVATTVGSGAATATAATSWLGVLGKGSGVLGGIMGVLDIASNWGRSTPAQGAAGGMAAGAAIGSFFPGVGTAIGAALGALGGGILGAIKSGKHEDQKARDGVRAQLQQAGFLDSNFNVKLADGSLYNVGVDGGKRDELGGLRPYEMDLNNPLVQQTIPWILPLTDLLFGGNEKLKSDFTGYLVNAALSNAKDEQGVAKNVQSLVGQLGLTPEKYEQSIVYRGQTGHFSEEETAVFLSGLKRQRELLVSK